MFSIVKGGIVMKKTFLALAALTATVEATLPVNTLWYDTGAAITEVIPNAVKAAKAKNVFFITIPPFTIEYIKILY